MWTVISLQFDNEHIEMCKKAIELQKNHKMQVGDYYIHKAHNDMGLITHRYDSLTGKVNDESIFQFRNLTRKCLSFDLIPDHIIWIPTQRQLQEIVGKEKDRNDFGVIEYFMHWYNKNETHITDYSLDKMWLMFTMHILYGKMWMEDWEWEE